MRKIVAVIWVLLLICIVIGGVPKTKASTETPSYRYVFPLVYLEPQWEYSAYASRISVVALSEDTKLWIDANFNGVIDEHDPLFNLKSGKRFTIGTADGAYANTPTDYEWKKNPIVLYSNKPIGTLFWYDTNDYGDYDASRFGYAAPTLGTKLLGVNVRWLYITPWEKTAKVYINGKFAGTVEYGKVLVKRFDKPTTVVVTSDNPVVAVSAYVNPDYRSMGHAFPLMPPSTGEVVIPRSVKKYAEERGTKKVTEYYVIVDENGNIVKNETLPSEPKVITLTKPSVVFVFRTFYYGDPWGGGAPRYAMSATALKPTQESTCYGYIFPPSRHGVISEVAIYAKSDVKLYKDYDADESIDETETLSKGKLYMISTYNMDTESKMLVYAEGNLACSYISVGGWAEQLENAYELSSSPHMGLYEQGVGGVSPQPTQPKTVEYLTSEDLSKWKYYREVTIKEQSGKTLENFQVLIELNSNNFDFSKALPDGSDVRIVDENGNFLPYWIEEWNLTAKRARIWTIVPKIPANGEVKLRLYYGNPNAQSRSDGDKVFEFFDDFNGNQLDTSKWMPYHTIGDLGKADSVPREYDRNVKVQNGFLVLSISSGDWDSTTSTGFSRGVKSKVCLPENSVVEARYINAEYAERASNNGLFIGEFFTSKISKPGISFRNSVETYGSTYLFFEINQAIWDNVIGYKNKVYQEGIYKISRIGSDTWKAEFFSPAEGWFSLGTAQDTLPDTTFSLHIGEWNRPRDTSVKFDWIFVRKYAPKDPLAIVGSEVSTSGEASTTPTNTHTSTPTSTLAPVASSAIDTAKGILSKIPGSVDVGDAKTMLEEAQKAYENQDYELAKKFAETAQALAVKAYYDKLRTDLQVKENQGQDVGEAKDLLQQAYNAYQHKDYTEALEILAQADLVLQGVQPKKSSPLKYLALLAVIGGVGVAGMAYSKRKKAEEERLRADFDASLKSGDNIVEKDQFGALEYYSRAFGIAKKLGDPNLVAKAQEKLNTVRGTVIAEINSLIARGNEALAKSDYDKALAYYRQALNLAEKLNDKDKIREAKSKMEGVNKVRKIRELISEGDVLMEGEKYSGALKRYKEALTIANELGDSYLIELLKGRISKASEVVEKTNAAVSSLIGQASRDMMEEDYESAVEKLSQALVLAEKIGGTVSVEDIKAKLEEAKKRKELSDRLREAKSTKDHAEALSLYEDALRLAQELGDEGKAAQIRDKIEEIKRVQILETLKEGVSLILPKEVPYGREVTLSINVENRLNETIENLTVDLSELSPYFALGEEKITFPPIRPGRKLGKDIVIKPQFKGDFDFSVKISSSIGETLKTLKVKVGDYYVPSQFTPKPLTPKSAPEELESLYEDFKYIGEGGFARVFRARRKKDGKIVAVKIPKTLDPATGKAFVREISNWLHLKHSNIVELYDVNVIPIPYLEMEYCEGSLAKLGKPMDVEQAAHIVFNVAEGLKYAHSKGIIHRDLKPSNILLKAGVPKISDWGLSKVMSESKSSTLASFTPYYASPEQLSPRRFGHTDGRTDIWQLGVLFYELVTGKLPFKGRDLGEVTFAIINEEPVPPSKINPEAKIVEPIIMKMLAKRKEERYQSVEELQKDLAKVLNITYVEGLKKSKDLKRTVFYIGDLALINLKVGNLKEALKYLLELRDYAGKYRDDLDWLIGQVKLAMEENIKLGEEAVMKADLIVHQIKMGRQR